PGAPAHAELARVRGGAGRSAVSLLPGLLSNRLRPLRDAGLGAVAGLGVAIFHRAFLGGGVNPRLEYWILALAGMAAGALLGARGGAGRGPHGVAAIAGDDRRGPSPSGSSSSGGSSAPAPSSTG